MTLTHACRSSLSALTLVAALAAPAGAQTADAVVEKHLAALGGREALAKLTSRHATGTFTVTIAEGSLTGPIEAWAKAPNKARSHVELDLSPFGAAEKMVVDQRFDGTSGWSLNSMQGDNPITGNQLEHMRNNTFPSSLLHYKAAGATVELLAPEQLNGKSVIVLKLTPKSGAATRYFLDPSTHLTIRSVTTVSLPQGSGDAEQISEFSDYRVVDGVMLPFAVTNTTPMQEATIKWQSVKHNVAIDDALFSVKGPVPGGR
jgi:outer membrane lipoprotein-sorting protein